jgi:2',3'-cyclic-nucleotide 2'-phosphodiesterase/3'-nucleotidase
MDGLGRVVGFVVGAALVIQAPCAAVGGVPSEARITLLHTSDLHGSVMPFNDYANRPSNRGSLAQVATAVKQVREATDHPVLVLDSGDTIQGTPFEQFINVRWGEGSPTVEAMNLIGYDAMAVGNHEFNFGLDVLRSAQKQASFPWLSANTIESAEGVPAFKPYTVVEAGPIRVGLLGLITPNVPGWEKPENYAGLEFEPMDEAARYWVPMLRDNEDCDVVVVLAHTGFEHDRETGEPDGTAHENFAARLATVPGIDVLLTGHTHEDIAPHEVNGVIVSQPSARARMVTRVDLRLVNKGPKWIVDSWKGANLSMSSVEPDPEIVDAFTLAHQKVAAALDGPIGEVTGEIVVDRCRLEDCSAVDLIHTVQLEASRAQLSLASLLNTHTPPLRPGPVSWRWIHSFYVYSNTLEAVRLTGEQVRDVLEHTARYYDGLDCSGEDGCVVLTDDAIPRYNVDSMAGLSYRIDPTRPEGSRIRDLHFNGSPLDLHESFTVVCNSYRSAGGGFFPHLADAEVVWRSSEEMTDLIGDFFDRNRPFAPVVDGNWNIGRDLVAEEHSAGQAAVAREGHQAR